MRRVSAGAAKAVGSSALLQRQTSALRFGAPGRRRGPPGTPLSRRDCHKIQGLLSSHVFEPPLVVGLIPHLEPSTPTGAACMAGPHPANKQLVKGPSPGA